MNNNNYRKVIIISLFLGMALNSCNSRNDHFVLFPNDKSQAITIITNGDIRYIIAGNYAKIPDTNYIKIDISNIDPIGDEIGVCWNSGKYNWELVNHESRIVKNKLDTTKFKFNTSWELDNSGIPNASKYHKENCGTTGAYYFIPATGDNLTFEKK